MATPSSKQPAEAKAFLERLRSTPFPTSPTATPYEDIAEALRPCLEAERERRALWAQDRGNKALTDPYVGLVDPHGDGTLAADGSSIFRVRKRLAASDSTAERKQGEAKPGGPRSDSTPSDASYILALPEHLRDPHGDAAVENERDFFKNWHVFTEGIFSCWTPADWSGVLVAGGAVLATLAKVPDGDRESRKLLRPYYHEDSNWRSSDIDVFLYGMDEEAAKKKLVRLAAAVADGVPWDTLCVRSKNTVTLVSQHPYRHIQFVLRLYASPAEILQGFDVDASGFGFDGSRVWATPRALSALITQCNTIDMTRRSPSYEQRLAKYADRGFEIYWPELERGRIDTTIYERAPWTITGLARLLTLEKFATSDHRVAYIDARRKDRSRPAVDEKEKRKQSKNALPGDLIGMGRANGSRWLTSSSGYHSQAAAVHVPYGSKWSAKKIQKLLFTADLVLNARWNAKNNDMLGLHRHPSFFGTMTEVLGDCCQLCPAPQSAEEQQVHKERCIDFVSSELSFMVEDPSRQLMSGSFQPVTEGDWSEQAYMTTIEQLMQRVLENDVACIKGLIDIRDDEAKKKLLLERDYIGRTPLQLALLEHRTEAALMLIELGARITARTIDGRTEFMLAAQQGNVEVVKAMLARSAENRIAAEEAGLSVNEGEAGGMDVDQEDEESGSDSESDDESAVLVEHPGGTDLPIESDETPDVIDLAYVAWDTGIAALHYAVLGGSVEIVKMLLEAGANPLQLGSGLFPLTTIPFGIQDDAKAIEVMQALLDATTSSDYSTYFNIKGKKAPIVALTLLIYSRRPSLVAALLKRCGEAASRIDLATYAELDARGNTSIRASPLAAALHSGQLGLAAVLLQLGAKTYTTNQDCEALQSLSILRNVKPHWSDEKVDAYRDAMQPLEASLAQGNYGYKLLFGATQPPPITAPFNSFCLPKEYQETTLALVTTLAAGLDPADSALPVPGPEALAGEVRGAQGWSDVLVARIRQGASPGALRLIHEGAVPELQAYLEAEQRQIAEPYVTYFQQVRQDLLARGATTSWEQMLASLGLTLPDPRHGFNKELSDLERLAPSLAEQQKLLQTTSADLVYLIYTQGTYNADRALPRRLYPRAKALLDAAERGDDAKLRQLTLPPVDGSALTEELLPISVFFEAAPGSEFVKQFASPLTVALEAGKWDTFCTILDICCTQYSAEADAKSSDRDQALSRAEPDQNDDIEGGAPDAALAPIVSDYHPYRLITRTAEHNAEGGAFHGIRKAYATATEKDRQTILKALARALREDCQTTSFSLSKRVYLHGVCGCSIFVGLYHALLDDEPVLLQAIVTARGEGLAPYFAHAFKKLLKAGANEVQVGAGNHAPAAHYAGLLVGGKRRAAWAANPKSGQKLHDRDARDGTERPLIWLAAKLHAVRCLRMLCEDNFAGTKKLIMARRDYLATIIAEPGVSAENLERWKKELRVLEICDVDNSEHLARAAGSDFDVKHYGNPVAQALLRRDSQYGDIAADHDKRAVETATLLIKLLPHAADPIDLPFGEEYSESCLFLAPTPATVDFLLSHGASPTMVKYDGTNLLHCCNQAVLQHLCKTLPNDVLAGLLKQKKYGATGETPLHSALALAGRPQVLLALPDHVLAEAMRVRSGSHGLTPLGEAIRSQKDLALVELMLKTAKRLECLDLLRWEDVVGDIPLEHLERSILLRHTTSATRTRELPPLIHIPGGDRKLRWQSFTKRMAKRGTEHRNEAGQLAELRWAVEYCGAEMPSSLLATCKEVISILAEKTQGQEPDHNGLLEHALLAAVRAAMQEVPGPRVRVPPAIVQAAVKQKLDIYEWRYEEEEM